MKATLKKVGARVAAALTTPAAKAVEKQIAVISLKKAAIAVPAFAVAIDLVIKALGG